MKRIDHPTALPDANGTGKDGFTQGDATVQKPPTVVTDTWLNDVQEDLADVTDYSDIGSEPSDRSTLLRNMRAAIDMSKLGSVAAETSGISSLNAIAESDRGTMIAVKQIASTDVYYVDHERGTWATATAAASVVRHAATCCDELGIFVVAGASGDIHSVSASAPSTATQRTAAGSYTGTFYAAETAYETILLCGTGGEIQRSTDGGVTWTSVRSTASQDLTAITYNYETDRWIVVGSTASDLEYLILTSDDDGLTWDTQTAPTDAARDSYEPLQVQTLIDGTIMMVGRDGDYVDSAVYYYAAYISRDNGATWTRTGQLTYGSTPRNKRNVAISPSGVWFFFGIVSESPYIGDGHDRTALASHPDPKSIKGSGPRRLQADGVPFELFRTTYRWVWQLESNNYALGEVFVP